MSNPRHTPRSSGRRLGAAGPARSHAFQGTGAPAYRDVPGRRTVFLVALATVAVFALLVLCAGSALAAGDINQETCEAFPETEASPGFRASLPDCRAYELVSPAYGAGAIASGTGNRAPLISPDGEHLLAISFGAFAGAEELGQDYTEYGEVYEFSRTPTGWTAEPQDPPATQYPFRVGFVTASATNLGRSIWEIPQPLKPGEYPESERLNANNSEYVVREGRGDFALVGAAAAPGHLHEPGEAPNFSRIHGVSADVTHIDFEVSARNQQLWPGDSTVPTQAAERFSLYEYDGTGGGEPVLIGVKNKGAAPWQPGAAHINEGAELESQCGTTYDAISASGDSAIFTALAAQVEVAGQKFCEEHEGAGEGAGPEANELYARVNASETIDISKPSKKDCTACDTEGVQAEAVFAGASEDDSKVLFTSEQTLLPGASGDNLYEYNFAAVPGDKVTLVAPDIARIFQTGPHSEPGVPEIARISTTGNRIYFASTDELTSAPNGDGEKATKGIANMYVYDEAEPETLKFVAAGEGAEAFGSAKLDLTTDGQILAFSTLVDHGPDDTSTAAQLFEYNAATGGLTRVSVGQRSIGGYLCEATGTVEQGYDCDGNTKIQEDTPRLVLSSVDSVSENGTVVFTSELPLTPGAVQGRTFSKAETGTQTVENVYEYRDGQVYLLSPGDEATAARYQSSAQTRLLGIDTSGKDVFFSSVDPLVPQDSDTQSSWYDAREGGGFPAPAQPAGCTGEACQGSAPATPVFAAPGSNTLTGAGNLAPPVEPKPAVKPAVKAKAKSCKKGFVKRRGKCVKAPKSKRAKKSNKGRR